MNNMKTPHPRTKLGLKYRKMDLSTTSTNQDIHTAPKNPCYFPLSDMSEDTSSSKTGQVDSDKDIIPSSLTRKRLLNPKKTFVMDINDDYEESRSRSRAQVINASISSRSSIASSTRPLMLPANKASPKNRDDGKENMPMVKKSKSVKKKKDAIVPKPTEANPEEKENIVMQVNSGDKEPAKKLEKKNKFFKSRSATEAPKLVTDQKEITKAKKPTKKNDNVDPNNTPTEQPCKKSDDGSLYNPLLDITNNLESPNIQSLRRFRKRKTICYKEDGEEDDDESSVRLSQSCWEVIQLDLKSSSAISTPRKDLPPPAKKLPEMELIKPAKTYGRKNPAVEEAPKMVEVEELRENPLDKKRRWSDIQEKKNDSLDISAIFQDSPVQPNAESTRVYESENQQQNPQQPEEDKEKKDDHEGTSKPSKNKIGENKGQKQAKKPKMQKVNKKKDLPVTNPIQVTLTRAMNGDQQNDFSTAYPDTPVTRDHKSPLTKRKRGNGDVSNVMKSILEQAATGEATVIMNNKEAQEPAKKDAGTMTENGDHQCVCNCSNTDRLALALKNSIKDIVKEQIYEFCAEKANQFLDDYKTTVNK